MRLAPRIIQAMEILQLPIMALQERIDSEMESNPVLELHETAGPLEDEGAAPQDIESPERGERALVVKEGTDSQDFQRLSDFEDEYGPWTQDAPAYSRTVSPGERDRKMDAMANAPAPGETLNEYLQEQWKFVEVAPDVRAAGVLLINHIDEDGYLRITLEEVFAASDKTIPIDLLRRTLSLVQTLEPPGVGARDLQECLLLQLTAEQAAGRDVGLEIELVRNFLRDIEMNRLLQIVRRTGKTIEQIKAAIENLSHLNPRPGSLVGQRTAPVITPDVVVELDDQGEVIVSMPEGNTPHLYISRAYRKMAKDTGVARDAKQFIRRNIRSAQWLIGAIQQRRETVRRVVEEVFKVQREFLDNGPESLRPLPMVDVSSKVGVHVATVSRAVSGKYIQTPRGIFPLRMFFSGGKTTDAGQDVAWDAIRVKLKEVIDNEDKAHPLNDDQIVEAMTKAGINIARRTVAKYRGLLDIPPARKRKTF